MRQTERSTPWWQAIDRRTFGKGALAFATLASMSGCKGEEDVSGDSLALQKKHGWNLGAEESRLFFRAPMNQDAQGKTAWRSFTDPKRLIDAWRPESSTWEPFLIPTLMQALDSSSLRTQIRPIFFPQMDKAFKRAETMRTELLSQVTKGANTFFIVDMPGPEAVAFGAGLAGWADIIPAFDNWPHPFGVVRSHETLAAMLYYASYLQERKAKIAEPAPGVLLLDSQRLTPYTDSNTQFDNRYLATVPLPKALTQRGIENIMYIVPDRKQKTERDDLNDEFVEYKDAGLRVSIFPLSDLKEVRERVAKTNPDGSTRTVVERNYYYGGGFGSHLGFLMMYSFLAPRPTAYYNYPYTGTGRPRRVTLNDTRTSTRPPNYTPRSRPTQFSGSRVGGGKGVGRAKPSGFGRSTVRMSGNRVTSVRSGRSGSFGRGGFSSSS